MRKLLISILLLSLIFSVPAYCQTEIDGRQIRANSINADRIIGGIASPNQVVQLEAAESLTAGDVCSIISSGGTQKAIKNNLAVNTSPNGSEQIFNSAATSYISCVSLDSTRFLVAYIKGTKYYSIVGTVTGSTIAWGSESAEFENITAGYQIGLALIDTDKVFASYYDGSNAKLRGVVLSISTSTITINTPVDIETGILVDGNALTKLDTNTVLACYSVSVPKARSKVITISGTTPTPYPAAGTAGTEFNAAATAYISCSALSSTSVICAYRDGGNSNYGVAQILSISDTTITPGTEYVFYDGTTTYINTSKVSGTKSAIVYRKDSLNLYGHILIVTNNSGALSFGSESAYSGANATYNSCSLIDATHLIIAWNDENTNGKQVIATIGNSDVISIGSAYIINSGATPYIAQCYLGSNKSAIVFGDTNNSNYGTCCINTWATSDYSQIRGIATANTSSGNSAPILISGSFKGLTSLIQGADYFVQSDYSLATTPVLLNGSYIKMGVAKSSTEILVE